jgi:hypothetical protein
MAALTPGLRTTMNPDLTPSPPSHTQCSICGQQHALEDFEPALGLPDDYLAVPETEREFRTLRGSDTVCVRSLDDSVRQYYLRCVMPFVVERDRDCAWGIWVEITAADYGMVRDRWRDPRQAEQPAFAGRLANALPGYQATKGLRGAVRLTGPETRPHFVLDRDQDHPLVHEQVEGVNRAVVQRWLHDVMA